MPLPNVSDSTDSTGAATTTCARLVVDALLTHGVERVFCVPGESFLGILDAFYDRDVTVTVCRQEGGAAMMAEAVGKATGRPGICFVTQIGRASCRERV